MAPLTTHMPPFEEAPLALIVDDDEPFRNRLCRALTERHWEASAVASAEEAIRFAGDRSPDLVLVDLRMPGAGGLDLIPQLRAIDSSMAIIVLTGYGSIPTAISAMKRGADHYLSKRPTQTRSSALTRVSEPPPRNPPSSPTLFPAWRESNGNTCSASFPIAEATFRKPRACWGSIDDRCSGNFQNIHPRADPVISPGGSIFARFHTDDRGA